MNETSNDEKCLSRSGLDGVNLESFIKSLNGGLLVACVLSTVLQAYVIVTAVKYIRRHVSDRYMHIFLLNMTIADCLLTAYAYPKEFLLNFYQNLVVLNALKLTMHIVLWFGLSVSALSLVLLNLDKLVYFKFPLKYPKIITHTRAIILVLATWAFSATFIGITFGTGALDCADTHLPALLEDPTVDGSDYYAVARAMNYSYPQEILRLDKFPNGSRQVVVRECLGIQISKDYPHGKTMYWFFVLAVSIIPVVSSLIVALYILRVVQAHRRHIAEEQALVATTGGIRRNRQLLTRMRTFYFIFVSTIFTVVTLVPFRLYMLFSIQTPEKKPYCDVILFAQVIYHIQYLNAILNPVITVTVLPQYRFEFLKLSRFTYPRRNTEEISTRFSEDAL